MRWCRDGFTLIEMLGVLAIMAVLSASASIVLSGPRHAADFKEGVEQLEQADASARTIARSTDQNVILSLSLPGGQITRSNGNIDTTLGTIPRDDKIVRVRMVQDIVDFGSAAITFNSHGSSPSYAVKLAGASGASQWIIFAGLTGQALRVSDEEVDAILQEISGSSRVDAH